MDFQGRRRLVLFYSLPETSELLTVCLLTSFWLDVAAEWSTDAGDLVERLCQLKSLCVFSFPKAGPAGFLE